MTDSATPAGPSSSPPVKHVPPNKQLAPNKRTKSILAIGLIALLIVLTGGGYWWWQRQISISTDNAKVDCDTIELSTRLPGRIEAVVVQEGQRAAAGDTLFQLETVQLEAEVLRTQANLETARITFDKIKAGPRPEELQMAQLEVEKAGAAYARTENLKTQAEIELDELQQDLGRKEALYQTGVISLEAIESLRHKANAAKARLGAAEASQIEAESSLKNAQAKQSLISQEPMQSDLEILAAQVKQAEAAGLLAQTNLDAATIKAPVAGTVVRINAQPGEMVNVGQAVLTLINLDQVWIKANIDETLIKRVAIGQSVQISIDAYPGQLFSGKIIDIGNTAGSIFSLLPSDSSAGNFTKLTQRVPVKIQIEPAGFSLYPGLSAKVKIFTR